MISRRGQFKALFASLFASITLRGGDVSGEFNRKATVTLIIPRTTRDRMDMALGNTGPDRPITIIEGWRFFIDDNGFIPSAQNTCLVAKILCWKCGVDRYYAACIGNEGPHGIIQYRKGEDLRDGFTQTKISPYWFAENGQKGIRKEARCSLSRLILLVSRCEGINISQ